MENASSSGNPSTNSPSPEELGTAQVSHIETCVFWRCARSVLNQGNPASDNVVVFIPGCDGEKYPLMILTLTRANRLICWPALPNRVCAPNQEDKLHLIDHVTLELDSKRSHSTEFDSRGGKRYAKKWNTCSFERNGVSFWFGFAMRRCAIEDQILERHQWIRMPTPDKERRLDEFKRFFERLKFVDANLPTECEPAYNSVVALVYIVDGAEVKLSEDLLQPLNHLPEEFWEHPPEETGFSFVSTGLTVGSVQLGILLGFSSAKLREDGPILMIPRQRRTELCSTL